MCGGVADAVDVAATFLDAVGMVLGVVRGALVHLSAVLYGVGLAPVWRFGVGARLVTAAGVVCELGVGFGDLDMAIGRGVVQFRGLAAPFRAMAARPVPEPVREPLAALGGAIQLARGGDGQRARTVGIVVWHTRFGDAMGPPSSWSEEQDAAITGRLADLAGLLDLTEGEFWDPGALAAALHRQTEFDTAALVALRRLLLAVTDCIDSIDLTATPTGPGDRVVASVLDTVRPLLGGERLRSVAVRSIALAADAQAVIALAQACVTDADQLELLVHRIRSLNRGIGELIQLTGGDRLAGDVAWALEDVLGAAEYEQPERADPSLVMLRAMLAEVRRGRSSPPPASRTH